MAPHALNLALVVVMACVAAGHVAAQDVEGGCNGAVTGRTASKGFFSISGRCYLMRRKSAPLSGHSCDARCNLQDMVCLGPEQTPERTEAECTALLDAYLASNANYGFITDPFPATPPFVSASKTMPCALWKDATWGWLRGDSAKRMPLNSDTCTTGMDSDNVTPCECSIPPVTTVATVAQASFGSVTVTGTTDTPGSVFCMVRKAYSASGLSISAPIGSYVAQQGAQVIMPSAGSFTVTVPDVTISEDKKAYCAGMNGTITRAVSVAAAVSEVFSFVASLPLTSVDASYDGSTVTVTGMTSEAVTVHCVVAAAGSTIASTSIKDDGVSQALGAAGAFSVDVTVATMTGKNAFCVAEDAVGSLSEQVEQPVKQAPSSVSLSSAAVAENSAQGTEVGVLSATDPNDGDTASFTVVSQSAPDAFQISGDKLQVGTGVVDFEATPSVSVNVRATDSFGLTLDQELTVTVTDVNEAPTDLAATGLTFAEGSDQGTEVGTLSTSDPDADDTFTYTIASQAVVDAFQISGDKLQLGAGGTALVADDVVSVTLRTTDAGGLDYERSFGVTVEAGSTFVGVGVAVGAAVVLAGFMFGMFMLLGASGSSAGSAGGAAGV